MPVLCYLSLLWWAGGIELLLSVITSLLAKMSHAGHETIDNSPYKEKLIRINMETDKERLSVQHDIMSFSLLKRLIL